MRETGNPHKRRRHENHPRKAAHPMSPKVAVFGAGSWGTAFSLVLADAGNDGHHLGPA